jgi:diguanylate cyclase (GGDEF)-like protein
MISQARQVSTLIIASILAIPLLFIYINAEMDNMSVSRELDNLLLEIRHNNTELSELVLRSRSQLDQQYDSLANSQLKFSDTMIRFKTSLLTSNNEMNVHAEVVYSLYEVRMQQLEQFKSLNAQIKNALRYLPKLRQQLRPLLSSNNSLLLEAVDQVVSGALNFRLFNDLTILDHSNELLSLLENPRNKPLLNTNSPLGAFIKHARNFQVTSKIEQALINSILSNQLSDELLLLEKNLANKKNKEIENTNNIKKILITYSSFLLLLIIVFTLNRFHLINRVLFHKSLSEKDQLTSLNNRRSFIYRLKRSMKNVKQNDQFGALIFIDLDGFKIINDNLGHNAGDVVLKEIAKRLQNYADSIQSFETPICVARLGGDEFVVLFEQLNREDVSRITVSAAENIVATCARALPTPYNSYPLSASIGISLFPDHGDDVKTILNCADKAMYFSKSKGKNRFTFYQPSMHTD